MRHRQTREVHAWDLEHGSLMIMRNECQSDWEHCVPKSKKAQNLRINLTFRQILPAKLP
ncbi:MAG: alpha-ketoglutarate-dependent dioxygenase AlkB [Bacteroidia bacterium]